VGSSLLVCVFLGCGFLVVGCRPTCCVFVCVCVFVLLRVLNPFSSS
jgi:hypothetical protein